MRNAAGAVAMPNANRELIARSCGLDIGIFLPVIRRWGVGALVQSTGTPSRIPFYLDCWKFEFVWFIIICCHHKRDS